MIACRKCSWVGVSDDRKWGACPKCGHRAFRSDLELWAHRLAWSAFIGFLAYVIAQLPHAG